MLDLQFLSKKNKHWLNIIFLPVSVFSFFLSFFIFDTLSFIKIIKIKELVIANRCSN